MILLDTDIFIDVQRGHQPAVNWFASLTEIPHIPGFVLMELIQGAHNSEQLRQAQKLVAPFPIVWPTALDCHRALTNFTAYHLSHNLGLLDALIAACAVGLSATLCTCNHKHYRVIPDLVLEQPYDK